MEEILEKYKTIDTNKVKEWIFVGHVSQFPEDGGRCFKHEGLQIAIFNFGKSQNWYACQNLCPHKFEMVLSRGILGDDEGVPKVACPLHKSTFSLEDGRNLNGDLPSIATYPIKIENEEVYLGFSKT